MPNASSFTPERAERYVAETLPDLVARAAFHLGEPAPDGTASPAPSGRAARLAIQSANEVLASLGPVLTEDTRMAWRAAVGRVEALFRARHPRMPLVPGPGGTLLEQVEAAWEAGPEAPRPAPAEAPGVELPRRTGALD